MLKIEVAFPDKILTNSDLGLELNERTKKLGGKLGILERRVCAEDETAIDLAVKACEKLFKKINKDEVDFIIYCTQSPEYFLPTTACVLQDRLGLNKTVGAFDYNLGCSGYIYGLAMAKSFIQSGIAKNILLVTAEAYSKFIHEDDKSNRAIFGDAATATLMDSDLANRLGEFELGSDGSGADNLIVKGGAGKANFESSSSRESMFYMNGPEVFKFTLDNVPLSVEACLKKNNQTLNDIDYMILHQANAYMLKNLRRKIGIEKEKFHSDVEKTGNTVSNTIPIAIYNAQNKGLIKSGDCLLLSGFGVGYSWGATIINL